MNGIVKEVAWYNYYADGWGCGHGTVKLAFPQHTVLGCFRWIRNAVNEPERIGLEAYRFQRSTGNSRELAAG